MHPSLANNQHKLYRDLSSMARHDQHTKERISFTMSTQHGATSHIALRAIRTLLLPEWVFLVIALLVGGSCALLLPAGIGLDETNHIARASAIAEGEFTVHRIADRTGHTSPLDTEGADATLYGNTVDSALYDLAKTNTDRFNAGKNANGIMRYDFPTWQTPGVVNDLVVGQNSRVEAFSNTAVNSPFVYIPFVIGYWIAKAFTLNAYAIIIAMRFAGLLCFIAAMVCCIKAVPVGKWVMASIALLPSTLISASAVTADTVTFVCCMAYITMVLRCALCQRSISRQGWALLAVTTIILALIKLSYLPLLALLLIIPLANTATRNVRDVAIGCLVAAVTCCVFLVWYASIAHINTGAMFNVAASPTLQKQVIFSSPLRYVKLLIGQFASQNYFNIGAFGPLEAHGHLAYSGWATVLVLCCAVMLRDHREYGMPTLHKHAVSVTVIVGMVLYCVFVLIETALYLQYTPVGAEYIDGVQPRYFLPVLPLLLLPMMTVCHTGHSASSERSRPTSAAVLMCLLQLLSAVLTAYVVVTTLYV